MKPRLSEVPACSQSHVTRDPSDVSEEARRSELPHGGKALEAANKGGGEGIVGEGVFGTSRRQIDVEFDDGFEFFRMERKPKNTICAGIGDWKFPLRRNGKGDDRHFAWRPDFADLVHRFDNALRTRLEAGCRKEIVRRDNHEVEIFAAGFVGEFVDANRPDGIDAGAIIAEVEDKDFNKVANTAIRMTN